MKLSFPNHLIPSPALFKMPALHRWWFYAWTGQCRNLLDCLLELFRLGFFTFGLYLWRQLADINLKLTLFSTSARFGKNGTQEESEERGARCFEFGRRFRRHDSFPEVWSGGRDDLLHDAQQRLQVEGQHPGHLEEQAQVRSGKFCRTGETNIFPNVGSGRTLSWWSEGPEFSSHFRTTPM